MMSYLDISTGANIMCRTPLAPLRAEARETSEMESQILYGQRARVLESSKKDWIKVAMEEDGYIGWTDRKQFLVAGPAANEYFVTSVAGILYDDKGPLLLPYGSMLSEEETRNFQGAFSSPGQPDGDDGDVLAEARKFLGVPYLWGGKSCMGIDCSGLVQLVFREAGIILKRNTRQQIDAGVKILWNERQPGDLAFFANAGGQINHVGILDSTDTIIHASGYVHIDRIKEEGIIHRESQEKTHILNMIQRIGE